MKILHVIFSLETGGAEAMLVDIINQQSVTEQVELIIVNNSYDINLLAGLTNKIAVHRIGRRRGSINPVFVIKFNYLIFNIKADIIHFHDQNAIGLLFYKGKSKTCLTIHDMNKPVAYLHRYDLIFSISESVKNDILKRGLIKSIRIYNGIDFSKFKVKSSYSLKNEFRIVLIGRLYHEKKGQHIVLESLVHLIKEFPSISIFLDFIGEGPSLQFLQKKSNELGVSSHVNFLGKKSREYLYENLRNYNLLIQPSQFEGFGLTIVEGIAAGLPIIVSNIDGPAEIIDKVHSGWQFESASPWSLNLKIEEVINLYIDGGIESGCKTRHLKAREIFSIQQTSRNYLDCYNIA